MGFWRSRVLPVFRKPFERNDTKKAAAAEACKSFDDSKEDINSVYEEKKEELQPKVLEIYESSPADIKTVVKERNDAGLKKHAAAVNKFLEELVKIEFPGAKSAAEASVQFGPALVPGPVLFVLEKVATFVPVEEPRAAEVPDAVSEGAEEAPEAPAEENDGKEKEVAAEEDKKELDSKEEEEEEKAPAEAVPAAPAATEKKEETKEVEEVPAEAVAAAEKKEENALAAAEKKAEEEQENAPAAAVTPAATEATTSTTDQTPVAAEEAAPALATTVDLEASKA